ncbi:hypothetical protein [Roseisolibacter agri]|uniref:Uncharacterized protein n=1 Tax=Roseisolibacter agri TaxID=2014610 RepID=A0AA37Q2Y3_9BACT|nr:hypothetical protein [Roseisolibacter agri]GLC23632.1 hypothetical protein rosag_01450 [Roseisolibacter agri]
MPVRLVDASGVEWEVWELAPRPVLADAPPTPRFEAAMHDGGSWLCFESATQRRLLSRYPARWHAMLPHELEALCQAARPERPPMASAARAGRAW